MRSCILFALQIYRPSIQNISKRFHRNTMSSSSPWKGWIVPRVLPKLSDKNDDDHMLSINAMTSRHQIDPSLLSSERRANSDVVGTKVNSSSSRSSEVGSTEQLLIDTNSETTTLEVFLYPSHDIEGNKNKYSPINFMLERKSNELIEQTLYRMVLSLNKQVFKLNKSNCKQKKPQKEEKSANTNCVSVYKMSSDGAFKHWDLQGKTNMQLWKEALSTTIKVQLELINDITATFHVDVCPPTILTVKTFEDFTGRVFHDIPLVIEVESLFTTDVVIDWYAGDELVCNHSSAYTPQATHIGKYVSVIITPIRNSISSGRSSHEQAYRFENPIEALPVNTIVKLRQGDTWTDRNRRTKQATSKNIQSSPLRVMTYNILADQNAYARCNQGKQIPFYPYVNVSVLDRKRRMPLIIHEILSYQSDIICLQEVDEHLWRRIFRPVLENAGYQGFWSGKDAFGMAEGCALFWSLHRFESLSQEEMKCFSLNQLVLDVANEGDGTRWKSGASIARVLREQPDLKDVIENKLGHILQMVSLPLRRGENEWKSKSIPDRLLVANTHLFYHPRGAHIRLMQMYAICRQFERFQLEESSSYPMILCGDMNSSLRRAAGYLLLNRQVLSCHTQLRLHFNTFEWIDRKKDCADEYNDQEMGTEHGEEGDDMCNDEWRDFPPIELPEHFPSFLSGYPQEPKFTHYLDSFASTLDHIFVSQSSEHNAFGLTPVQCAPMPSVADVTEDVAMPSAKLPSDHISLVADLTWSSTR